MKLGGLLRPYPVDISPRYLVLKIKESREFEGRSKGLGFSQELKKSKFKRARDSRGFGTGLEARESQQRARRNLAIVSTKNETKIHHKRAQNEGIESIQKPRRHEEDRASFPNQIPHKVSTIHGQNQLKREEQREGDAGGRPGETESPRTDYKSRN